MPHRLFYIITLAAFALAITAAVAHDVPGISKEHQAWHSNAETAVEAPRVRTPTSDVAMSDASARVTELVDAHDSKSCSARSGGSIPSTGTTFEIA